MSIGNELPDHLLAQVMEINRAYARGLQDGHNSGYQEGYRKGLADGVEEARKLIEKTLPDFKVRR